MEILIWLLLMFVMFVLSGIGMAVAMIGCGYVEYSLRKEEILSRYTTYRVRDDSSPASKLKWDAFWKDGVPKWKVPSLRFCTVSHNNGTAYV